MKRHQRNDAETVDDSLADGIFKRSAQIQFSLDSLAAKSGLGPIPEGALGEQRNEEIVALRGWNLAVTSGNSYFLKSPNWGSFLWPKREPFKAVCIAEPVRRGINPFTRSFGLSLIRRRPSSPDGHNSPHLGCWCGVYGLKPGVRMALGGISGEAYLFGDYVEHDLGFRAQYAYPKNLTWFRCTYCETGYRMNNLLIPTASSAAFERSNVSDVYQVCVACLGSNLYRKKTDLIPLSYVIEKLEYEYNLEVAR